MKSLRYPLLHRTEDLMQATGETEDISSGTSHFISLPISKLHSCALHKLPHMFIAPLHCCPQLHPVFTGKPAALFLHGGKQERKENSMKASRKQFCIYLSVVGSCILGIVALNYKFLLRFDLKISASFDIQVKSIAAGSRIICISYH